MQKRLEKKSRNFFQRLAHVSAMKIFARRCQQIRPRCFRLYFGFRTIIFFMKTLPCVRDVAHGGSECVLIRWLFVCCVIVCLTWKSPSMGFSPFYLSADLDYRNHKIWVSSPDCTFWCTKIFMFIVMVFTRKCNSVTSLGDYAMTKLKKIGLFRN